MKKRFTLIEILVVIMIISVLMSMVVAGVIGVINSGKITKAQKDMSNLTLAFAAYKSEYNGNFPVNANDKEIIDPTRNNGDLDRYRLLISILTGDEEYAGRVQNTAQFKKFNPKKKSFLTKDPNYAHSEYDFKDPWNNYYVIMIDANGDNKTNGVTGAGDFLVWSYGPGGEDEDQINKIYSAVNQKISERKLDGYIWNGKDGIVTSWISVRNVDNEDDEK